jgi:hypothetical protein
MLPPRMGEDGRAVCQLSDRFQLIDVDRARANGRLMETGMAVGFMRFG